MTIALGSEKSLYFVFISKINIHIFAGYRTLCWECFLFIFWHWFVPYMCSSSVKIVTCASSCMKLGDILLFSWVFLLFCSQGSLWFHSEVWWGSYWSPWLGRTLHHSPLLWLTLRASHVKEKNLKIQPCASWFSKFWLTWRIRLPFKVFMLFALNFV